MRQRASFVAVYGFGVVGLLVILRICAIWVDVDPALATTTQMLGPVEGHPLGTDQNGRDVLDRLIASVSAFFGPALFACLAALLIAVPSGALVGFRPRSAPAALLRGLLAMVGAWPRLVVVVLVVAVYTVNAPADWTTSKIYVLAALVALSYVPQLAHALGERVLYFEREQFVEAARAHGLSDRRILGFHILWANCRFLILRQLCALFGAFILVETSLSYLGHYGVAEPRPSWGNMLAGVKSRVVLNRRLLVPESWTPGDVVEAVTRAVEHGGLLAVLAPTLLIAVSITGVLALGEYFAGRDR